MNGTNDVANRTHSALSPISCDFDILCGIPSVADSFAANLERQGFHRRSGAQIKLIIDVPRGFALHTLETLDRADLRLIVVTFSFCVEYWEDLWDLGPDALVVDVCYEHDFASALRRVSRGEKYRDTPNGKTPLSQTERHVLRYLARSWSNKKIARQLNLQEKTVANILTTIFRKLDLKNREEAMMHYWGLWRKFGRTPGS